MAAGAVVNGKHSCAGCGNPCDCGRLWASECERCDACVEVGWDYDDYTDEPDDTTDDRWGV